MTRTILAAARVRPAALGAICAIGALALASGAERADAAVTAAIDATTSPSFPRLVITGDPGDDVLELRLQAGNPNRLLIDVGADGSAEFSFDRSRFDFVRVNLGGGDDALIVEDRNGVIPEPVDGFGDAGNDQLVGSDGSETLRGGDGDDIVLGGRNNDAVLGGNGDDLLRAGAGRDSVLGGDGRDTIAGELGDDIISPGGSNDVVEWGVGDGNDDVRDEHGSDRFVMAGSNAAERVDVLPASSVPDGIPGGVRVRQDLGVADIDLLGIERVDVTANGGDDTVVASSGRLVALDVDAGSGADTVRGGDANDKITGGAGADTLVGGDGQDRIAAGADDDRIAGDAGDDFISGEAGDDVIEHALGDDSDLIDGGDGLDALTYRTGAGNDRVYLTADGSTLQLVREPIDGLELQGLERLVADLRTGNDHFLAFPSAGDLIPLEIEAGDGNDTVIGGGRPDAISGGSGNDTLSGGAGNDTLDGGDGNDHLLGDTGTDRLDGGPLSDRFNCGGPGDTVITDSRFDQVGFDCRTP